MQPEPPAFNQAPIAPDERGPAEGQGRAPGAPDPAPAPARRLPVLSAPPLASPTPIPDAVTAGADRERLLQRVAQLPQTPGVYLWKDATGRVLYVGKAKRLRSRVRSYWRTPAPTPRHDVLMTRVADLEVLHTPSEADALVLEARLIRDRRPPFNIALVEGGGGAPWVALTMQDPFPRLIVRRRPLHDGAIEIGPWTNPAHLRDALQLVREQFQVRSCAWDLPKSAPDRPCLDYHLKRCAAPCVGWQSAADYGTMIQQVGQVLRGESADLVATLQRQMEEASRDRRYERAAALRDQVRALAAAPTAGDRLTGLQVSAPIDADVFGLAREGADAVVVWLQVRAGAVLGAQTQLVEQATWASDAELIAPVLAQRWALLPPASRRTSSERSRVAGLADRAATVVLPSPLRWAMVDPGVTPAPQARLPRGPWRAISEAAQRQARQVLDDIQLAEARITERTVASVAALQQALGLATAPRRIVGFDIAHYSGKGTVAAAVRFENGAVHKAGVRTYKMRTVEGVDDFASMREAVLRWALRVVAKQEDGADLVLIDGGPQQLAMAVDALAAAELTDCPVVALAKRDELLFRPETPEPLQLPRHHLGLQLLQQVRDEAHRVGGRHLRQGTAKQLRQTSLRQVKGIGPVLAQLLLKTFGSVAHVLAASAEDLARVPGVSATRAATLHEALATLRPTAGATVAGEVPPPTAVAPAEIRV